MTDQTDVDLPPKKEPFCPHQYMVHPNAPWPDDAKKCRDCGANLWIILSVTSQELRLQCSDCHHKEFWNPLLSSYGGQSMKTIP